MIPKQKRPRGITLLALGFLWIGIGGGLFFPLIAGLAPFTTLWDPYAGRVIHSVFWLHATLYALLVLWYLFYLAYAAIGFGLWKLKNWARIALFAINIIGLVASVVTALFFVRPALFALAVGSGTVPFFLWIAWYTQRPQVRFAFGAWKPKQGEALESGMPPKLSGRGKALVVSGLGATLILYVGCLWAAVQNQIQSSEVFQATLKQAQISPCITNALGVPLATGWMTTGGMEEGADDGNANLSIPVRGPKADGKLEMIAEKHEGQWTITSLVFVHGLNRVQVAPPDPSAPCR
jgi:Cytochrome oxidase complex assembly protein 1